MGKTVSFGASALRTLVSEVAELDKKITASSGTMAAILKRAEADILPTPVGSATLAETVKQVEALGTLASDESTTWVTLAEAVKTLQTDISEAFAEAVKSAAADAQRTTGETAEALKTARSAKVVKVTAMASLLKDAGVDLSDIVLPTGSAPRPKSGVSGSSGKTGKAGSLRFYRVEADGSHTSLVKPWDVSLMAFRWFGKCGADALKSALPAEWGKGFSPVAITAGGKTWTIGCEVVEAPVVEAPKEDEAK